MSKLGGEGGMADKEQQCCKGNQTVRRSSKEKLGDTDTEIANVFNGNEKQLKIFAIK